MLIKPETRKLWEEALNHFRNAELLLKGKKFEEAEKEAMSALMLGWWAIIDLSKELKRPDVVL